MIAAVLIPDRALKIIGVAGLLVVGYFVGGMVAGGLAALLRPLLTWPLGVMLVGIFGGIAVYSAVVPVILVMEELEGDPDPMSLAGMAAIGVICGVLAGPPAALAFKWSAAAGR